VKVIGQPLSRIEGPLKVTGGLHYTADIKVAGAAQGVIVSSTIANGRTMSIDTNEAERAPGVLAVFTHRNMPMLEVDEKTFDRVYAVNVKSIFNMSHAVVPVMRKRGGGVILNIGSTAGIRPRPGLTWYNGSKAAVNLLSKSMAVELAPDRIRVNAICPVMGETGLLEQFMGVPDTPENRARFVATIPLGRLSKPSDVAAVAVFLASDAAHFLTGIEFPVDGGRTV